MKEVIPHFDNKFFVKSLDPQTLKLLLAHGLDVNLKDSFLKNGKRASHGLTLLMQALIPKNNEQEASEDLILESSCYDEINKIPALIKTILEAGAKTNMIDIGADRLLITLIRGGTILLSTINLCQTLLEKYKKKTIATQLQP